ncbi:hypothetical protein PSN45_001024 [Yamadazyma tenuis]|uniref:uncharacterized protein n=1 Tax=Candida tenuis TaxID=2315449 RepID=UPI0027A22E89|nr:hypothetical protein PSN45_001024 [Yamadazyma tenuis]
MSVHSKPDLSDPAKLADSIRYISSENTDLKCKLLKLINDYKLLKQFVLNNDHSVSRKRSFTAVDMAGDRHQMAMDLDLDLDLNLDLPLDRLDSIDSVLDMAVDTLVVPTAVSRTGDAAAPDELLDFLEDEEFDDDFDIESPLLSRTSSPSDDDTHSLMATLTRSTTVSTNNSFSEKPSGRFFEMPKFAGGLAAGSASAGKNLSSRFDVLQQDKYNLINDFLEEKLIDNDLTYYESLDMGDC